MLSQIFIGRLSITSIFDVYSDDPFTRMLQEYAKGRLMKKLISRLPHRCLCYNDTEPIGKQDVKQGFRKRKESSICFLLFCA